MNDNEEQKVMIRVFKEVLAIAESMKTEEGASCCEKFIAALKTKVEEHNKKPEEKIEAFLDSLQNVPNALGLPALSTVPTPKMFTVKANGGTFVVEVATDPVSYVTAIMKKRDIERTVRDLIRNKFPGQPWVVQVKIKAPWQPGRCVSFRGAYPRRI